MTKPSRISASDIVRAKEAAEMAGLRLVGLEKRPDGTVRLEFGEYADTNDWRASSPLYEQRL